MPKLNPFQILLFLISVYNTILYGNASSSNSNQCHNHNHNQMNVSWQLQQQQLLQLRSIYLSEVLSNNRGVTNIPTVLSVATLDSERADPIGWECALSTEDQPKSCLYSFDAPLNTKVVAPASSKDEESLQWISLAALNRLRRTDPSKVEPMWHGKYAIRNAWFGDSEHSLMQYIGLKGWAVTTLLDVRFFLRSLLVAAIALFTIVFMPHIEYIVSRIVVSGPFWATYNTWGRFANAALPFKLLMVQMIWKLLAGRFDALEELIRNYFVELECNILEETIPITIGEGAGLEDDDDELTCAPEMLDDEVVITEELSSETYSSDDTATDSDDY